MKLNIREKKQLDATEKQGTKHLEAINKQVKQLKRSIIKKRAIKKEESKNIVLLKDNSNGTLMSSDMNFY